MHTIAVGVADTIGQETLPTRRLKYLCCQDDELGTFKNPLPWNVMRSPPSTLTPVSSIPETADTDSCALNVTAEAAFPMLLIVTSTRFALAIGIARDKQVSDVPSAATDSTEQSAPPTRTTLLLGETSNPLPVIVRCSRPAALPDAGAMEVTVAVNEVEYAYWVAAVD